MDKETNSGLALKKRRKLVESTATFGIILIALALLAPLSSMNQEFFGYFKWVFAAGAIIYTTARTVNVSDPDESKRLRRLRRLEFWGGIAFIIAAAFWFYNESRLASVPYVGPLAIMKDTITFALVGAVLQIVASWLIYSQAKKEGLTS